MSSFVSCLDFESCGCHGAHWTISWLSESAACDFDVENIPATFNAEPATLITRRWKRGILRGQDGVGGINIQAHCAVAERKIP